MKQADAPNSYLLGSSMTSMLLLLALLLGVSSLALFAVLCENRSLQRDLNHARTNVSQYKVALDERDATIARLRAKGWERDAEAKEVKSQ